MVNFTGNFVQYTMETDTTTDTSASSTARITVTFPASFRQKTVTVDSRPSTGQVYPR
jgi:hypothetical protein